jgi:hypothetical protein
MNSTDFQSILETEPRSQDPDFIAAREKDPKLRRAWSEAMQFEADLAEALRVPVPPDLKSRITFYQAGEATRRVHRRWLAVAASLVVATVLITSWWWKNQPGPIEQFVLEALMMEPAEFMTESELPQEKVKKLLASLNTRIEGNLGQVRFMKTCPTPGGTGARMVLMTDSGPVTILYMPKAQLSKRIEFEVKDMKGAIVALEEGAAAIIGNSNRQIAQVENDWISRLKPMNPAEQLPPSPNNSAQLIDHRQPL